MSIVLTLKNKVLMSKDLLSFKSYKDLFNSCFNFAWVKFSLAHVGHFWAELNSITQGYLKSFHRYEFLKANSTNKLACLQRDWNRQTVCKQTSLFIN